MPHLYFPGQPVRYETGEAVATLIRKGWTELPPQPTPDATWEGEQWLVPQPPAEQLNYESFYGGVLNSVTYQQVLVPLLLGGSSVQITGTMALFGFAIQDAMAGRVQANTPEQPNSLQSAIWLLMSVVGSQLSVENLAELQSLLEGAGLVPTYALQPPTP